MSVVRQIDGDLIQKMDFTGKASAFLDRVPVLSDKIQKAADVEEKDVNPLLSEVLKFLFLIGYSNQRLTPSMIVDMAWHEFILCTKMYHDFCDQYFGRYIHHHPGGGDEENLTQFQLTHKTYNELIGTPPERFWGVDPTSRNDLNCGVCESIK